MSLKDKQLKILHVVDVFPSISTPFILNQITGLIDRGIEVKILTKKTGNNKIIHEDIKKYNLINKTYSFDNINMSIKSRIVYFISNFIKSFFKNPKVIIKSLNIFKYKKHALSLRLFYEANSLLKYNFEKFDIIHAQFGTIGVTIQRLKEIGVIKGKLITHFRGYDLEKTLRFEGKNYYKTLFEKGDFFLTNCNFFKDYIIKKGAPPQKTKVQYSGIKTSFFNTQKTSYKLTETLKLCSVGSLREKKGHKYILEALKILDNQKIQFIYEIVGDGILRNKLEKQVKDLSLQNKVKFHGAQNHSFIKTFLKNFDVFLSHNIKTDDGDMDAPVNTIKEAMLIGIPVISTYHGGIPEVILQNKTGFMTNEKNIPEITNAIKHVIDLYNKNKIETITKNARILVFEKFDNDMLNDKLLSIYYSVKNKQ